MKEKLAFILVIAGVIALPWWFFNYTAKYALCEDVKQMQKTFDYKFKSMEIREVDRRIGQWDDKCNQKVPDKQACEEAKRLRIERDQYEQELKELGKKK